MNVHLTWKQQLAKKLLTKEQFQRELSEDVKQEQDLLQRDILNRSLELIDAQYKLAGQKARMAFLGQWMVRTANEIPSVVGSTVFVNADDTIRP